MSELIPNLDDLRQQLPIDGTAEDAHAFLREIEKAQTAAEIDANVATLVDKWVEIRDERKS